MALTVRHYLIDEDGALKRVPRRIAEALPFGKDAIPEYAGTRQRVAEVLIDNQDRRPVRILDVVGSYWTFDDKGRIDEGLHASSAEWINLAFSEVHAKKSRGTVVDLVPELKKKELHERHRWKIDKDLLDLIAADIWPGVHGPAPDVSVVKGKAPRRPALTYRARNALAEIGIKVSQIEFEIADLGEPDLRGLEFEALRTAGFDGGPIWPGVAAEAKKQREIRAAHRTGKGEWIAVLDVFRVISPSAMDTVLTAHERCANREAAVEAGRKLMAERADWFGPDTMIEVRIYSALEWSPGEE